MTLQETIDLTRSFIQDISAEYGLLYSEPTQQLLDQLDKQAKAPISIVAMMCWEMMNMLIIHLPELGYKPQVVKDEIANALREHLSS